MRWYKSVGISLLLAASIPTSAFGGDGCKDKDKCGKGSPTAPKMPPPTPKPSMGATMSPFKAKASGATAGVSVGGAQDIGYARKIIAAGGVPQPQTFAAEGLFSEHDFSLNSTGCKKLFCLTPDASEVKILPDNDSWVLVQLGLDSGIDLASFKRQPQNLVVVLDRSGSMDGERIAAARKALTELVDNLNEKDRLGVVLFDDRVDVLFESTVMTNGAKTEIKSMIAGVEARGSTDIDLGLKRGYEMASKHAGKSGVSDRVMLFTDAQPNTGNTDKDHFEGLAKSYGEKNIGTTFFGVGINFGYSIAELMSSVKGANFVFLESPEKLEKVFHEDFDFLVTPIAYDFNVTIEAATGYDLDQTYGIPKTKENQDKANTKVSTLFLSKEKGTIAVRVKREAANKPQAEVAYLSLSYTPIGEKTIYETAKVELSDTVHPGVAQLSSLLSMSLTLEKVTKAYQSGNKDLAEELLPPLSKKLRTDATLLSDISLSKEADLIDQLQKNIKKPATAAADPDDGFFTK
jgi:Ca-activated chloride channel family protein